MTLLNLERRLLAAMYKISSVLNTSLNYVESSDKILQVLHDECALQCGMLTILDSTRDILLIKSVHTPQPNSAAQTSRCLIKSAKDWWVKFCAKAEISCCTIFGSDQRFATSWHSYDYENRLSASLWKMPMAKWLALCPLSRQSLWKASSPLQTNFLKWLPTLIAKNVQLAYKVETHQQQLVDERDNLRRKVRNNYSFRNLVGHTKSMRQIFEQIRLVSRWDSTVLIRGESGTGKELVANAIHYNSPRANLLPFVNWTVQLCQITCLNQSYLGMKKARLRERWSSAKVDLKWRTTAPFFLMKSVKPACVSKAKLLRVLQEKEFEHCGWNHHHFG